RPAPGRPQQRMWEEWEGARWAAREEEQAPPHAPSWELGLSGEIPALQLETMTTLPMPAVRPQEHRRSGSGDPPLEAVGLRAATSLPDDLPIDEMPTWILPAVGIKSVSDRTTMRLSAVVAGAASYITMLRSLAKTSAIYAIAALGTPLIALVLAPFL